jgi:O-acetyl-ADP-ribose deacetylase (regulator of RNase III)
LISNFAGALKRARLSLQMADTPQPLRLFVTPERTIVIAGPADITKESCDAIVNAANSSLMGGGGVDGAIHRAAGATILQECIAIVDRQGRLPAGKAVATTGGRLAAKYVIHTVGPVWHGGRENEPETLASCHIEAIGVADELGLANVAFPAISTGIYGYPVELAAQVAVRSAAEALGRATNIKEVKFVLFDTTALQSFCDAAKAYADANSLRLDSYHAS